MKSINVNSNYLKKHNLGIHYLVTNIHFNSVVILCQYFLLIVS